MRVRSSVKNSCAAAWSGVSPLDISDWSMMPSNGDDLALYQRQESIARLFVNRDRSFMATRRDASTSARQSNVPKRRRLGGKPHCFLGIMPGVMEKPCLRFDGPSHS